ncbi:SAM hydrolase/SAM-dependent halogenase family protein, partial [Thiolapillus sp.]|uniref:SAM hydrolase/SAM-dependent halogenase family protein n=1 Tax=Thiolapillus sp. TaxID=2017437 RepID=UPI003AF7BE51
MALFWEQRFSWLYWLQARIAVRRDIHEHSCILFHRLQQPWPLSSHGPYLGQMESAVLAVAPQARIINLMNDAPFANPRASAYLLAALNNYLPENAVVVAVVDPGVGGSRKAICLNIGDRWYLGPDNGLLSLLVSNAGVENCFLAGLHESYMKAASASFHGRDVFAPVAGLLVNGQSPDTYPLPVDGMAGASWPGELAEVIYLDGFGNAMTGLRMRNLRDLQGVVVGEQLVKPAHTFSSVPAGALFCYENSLGLLEIAANGSNAGRILGLEIGSPVNSTLSYFPTPPPTGFCGSLSSPVSLLNKSGELFGCRFW